MGFKLSGIWAGRNKQALAKEEDNTFRPKEQRLTGGLAANGRLLRGIYDESNQDFALGAYTLTGFVKVYKNLIGIPGITTDGNTTLVQ
jgi:hypothetical protein